MTADRTFLRLEDEGAGGARGRIGRDEEVFARIAELLDRRREALGDQLHELQRTAGADGAARIERDERITMVRRRILALDGVVADFCLGRMDPLEGDPVHIGRLGVVDDDGRPLLLDWRAPAARPFFAATRADPQGLLSRRRYRWAQGVVTHCADEVLQPELITAEHAATLVQDEESMMLAALSAARTPRMRDALSTLAADQDAIIRAPAAGPLVVDGGPGTGKTVVALHRAAYLLHEDPRLRRREEQILVLGPHRPYLEYVADVLPSLGHDVTTATLEDLVDEGAEALPEPDPRVAEVKARGDLVDAVDQAVALYEQAPSSELGVETPWGAVQLAPLHWQEAFDAVDPATPHNLAREMIWEELAEIAREQLSTDLEPEEIRSALEADEELTSALHRAWPLLRAEDVVADLYEVPAYLRRCAPGLDADQREVLQRDPSAPWTLSDLPLLDAARRRLGDERTEERALRRRREVRRVAEQMDEVVEELISRDSSQMQTMSMLRGADLRGRLDAQVVTEQAPPDELAGPFGHIVVDEAQELTDAQWRMVLARCPSHRMTIVGDRAQSCRPFEESWESRLERAGLRRVRTTHLRLNYRTHAPIMEEARTAVLAEVPDANVPESLRSEGSPVRRGTPSELIDVLGRWSREHAEGTACVITADETLADAAARQLGHLAGQLGERLRVLPADQTRGLEFDLAVVLDPSRLGEGRTGAVLRYIAMTRATQELVLLG